MLLLVVTVVFCSPCAIAAKVKTKEQARQKINHLKWLERVEHNKLYKNQQKLESTATNLANSKNKLSSTTNELAAMEEQLRIATNEFTAIDFRMKSRIRQVYKSRSCCNCNGVLKKVSPVKYASFVSVLGAIESSIAIAGDIKKTETTNTMTFFNLFINLI